MDLDTTREAAELQRTVLASLSGVVRLQQALDLSQFVADLSAVGAAARAEASSDAGGIRTPDSSPA
jgi:hypothetical protein